MYWLWSLGLSMLLCLSDCGACCVCCNFGIACVHCIVLDRLSYLAVVPVMPVTLCKFVVSVVSNACAMFNAFSVWLCLSFLADPLHCWTSHLSSMMCCCVVDSPEWCHQTKKTAYLMNQACAIMTTDKYILIILSNIVTLSKCVWVLSLLPWGRGQLFMRITGVNYFKSSWNQTAGLVQTTPWRAQSTLGQEKNQL